MKLFDEKIKRKDRAVLACYILPFAQRLLHSASSHPNKKKLTFTITFPVTFHLDLFFNFRNDVVCSIFIYNTTAYPCQQIPGMVMIGEVRYKVLHENKETDQR